MKKVIGMTGASSPVAQALAKKLTESGYSVQLFGRQQAHHFSMNPFQIADCSLDLMIHLAWDFKTSEPEATNVQGSQQLIQWCQDRQIPILFVSTLSAFTGTPSQYGQMKLKVEAMVEACQGQVVRPGLIYSFEVPVGIVGVLQKLFGGLPFYPVILPKSQQYPIELPKFCDSFVKILETHDLPRLISIREDRAIDFSEFLKRCFPKKISILVPWQMIWFPLWLAGKLGIQLRPGLDSLVGLKNHDPHPPVKI